jgi:hypothetical protein
LLAKEEIIDVHFCLEGSSPASYAEEPWHRLVNGR